MADNTKDTQMTLKDHLAELRRRLFWVVFTLLLAAVAGYMLRHQIIDALLAPLGTNESLIYTSPAGGLEFLFKICLFVGFIAAVPVGIYQLIRFLEPAIRRQTRKSMFILVVSSTLLAFGGAAFGYFVSLPAALNFLTNFNSEQIQALLSTNEYLSFVMLYLAGFALIFQVPLVILFINSNITPLDPRKLQNNQRYVVVASFIIAAIITPTPDPMNQFLMAAPAIFQYQVGVVGVWVKNRKRTAEIQEKKANESIIGELPDDIVEDLAAEPLTPLPESLPQPAYYAPVQSPANPRPRRTVDGITHPKNNYRAPSYQSRGTVSGYERQRGVNREEVQYSKRPLSIDGIMPSLSQQEI